LPKQTRRESGKQQQDCRLVGQFFQEVLRKSSMLLAAKTNSRAVAPTARK
jgi:hypothetical protein